MFGLITPEAREGGGFDEASTAGRKSKVKSQKSKVKSQNKDSISFLEI
jgi:hypothetical protein